MGRRLVRSRRVIVAPVVVGNKFFCGVLDADPGAGARRREMLLVEVLLLVSLRQKRYVAVALIDHSGGENQLGVAFASENARKACRDDVKLGRKCLRVRSCHEFDGLRGHARVLPRSDAHGHLLLVRISDANDDLGSPTRQVFEVVVHHERECCGLPAKW